MRQFVLLFLALTLAACAKQDDGEKLEKSVTSWRATLQFVAGARLGNEVGAGFARKTIDAAIEDLTTQTAAPSLPKELTARAEKVIGAAGELRRAIESDDRAGIARARGELAEEPAKSQ
ncbi:MAG: hypothetical protein QOC81_3230 [Thermoanaerobaculia bacterium]|jgi:hypothetical protein|nr:hypothetical protein [Thermoanaerobaculia bacterium]